MSSPRSVIIEKSSKPEKKKMAIFSYDNGRTKTIHFGAAGMSDFTIHKDRKRKQRYINRHKRNENWNVADTAGSLSRWVLWNKPDYGQSVADYKRRFSLKF